MIYYIVVIEGEEPSVYDNENAAFIDFILNIKGKYENDGFPKEGLKQLFGYNYDGKVVMAFPIEIVDYDLFRKENKYNDFN